MNTKAKMQRIRLSIFIIMLVFIPGKPTSVFADVTYSLHLDGVDPGIAAEITASVQEAVAIYNKYGSFNKHLNIYYDAGVPTAQANYDGVITFGGSRNTRVALHEMGHTMGSGTYWQWSNYMVGGVWQGYYAHTLAIDMGSPYPDGLHGDSIHFWPWGLNYDSEDGFMERIKHVRIVAAWRCDMGIMAYSKEAEHQIVPLGDTAMFGVASPIADSYQWYKDGSPLSNGGDISGANRSTLQIANVELSDEGDYYCAATGASETLNCRTVRLIIQQQVGQWDFEGNANDSVGSYDGTTYGSPTYPTGKIGQAIDLDGSNDYVTLPAGVADTDDITVAMWVNWDGGGQWQRIFDFGTSTDQYMFLTPRSGSNTLRFALKDGGSEQIVETTQLTTGQWVHVAVTLRGSVATLYVDGAVAGTNDSVMIDPKDFSPTINYIGDSQWSADPFFDGRIDDFRIYNYARSGSEIWNLWGQSTNNPPVFSSDPIIMPNANEDVPYSGQTLADYASDPDSDPLTYSKVGGPTWLNVAANGTLSGTPGSGDAGENTFVVRVTDSSGASDDATLIITVNGSAAVYYPFEGTTDDSAGSNHGTATGSPAYTTGILGQAIDLDGTDDYITLPSGMVNMDDLTIAAWINWDGGGQWQRIFDFGTGTNEYMFLTPNTGSVMRFAITASGNGTDEQRLETAGLATGQWVHVVVTLSGNTGRLYVNGELKDINAAMTIDPLDFNPSNNYIGDSQWSADPLFNGRIDEFRIYSYALSDTEVEALYYWRPFVGLISHWPLDESEGTMAPDVAGENDGTIIGSPIWEPNDGAINGALAFDGEDDYVDLDTPTDLGSASAFTICFWVNPAQLPFDGHEGIIGIGTASQRAPWIWGNYNSCNLRMQFETTAGGISDGDLQIGEMAEDTWTHVAVTWDGSTCSSYINGVFDNADDTTGNILVVSDGINYLGYIADYGYWQGLLDDIRVYNYELSPAEIGGLYLQGRPTDLDEDGDVDFVDLYTFAGQYLQPPSQSADFNNDGTVNLADYAEMAIDWMKGVE